MATSTFGKEFKVGKNQARNFVKEMKKTTSPTLTSNFQSKQVSVHEIKGLLDKVLKPN